jgi:hypothetical protein
MKCRNGKEELPQMKGNIQCNEEYNEKIDKVFSDE